jgi:hypothetical protein
MASSRSSKLLDIIGPSSPGRNLPFGVLQVVVQPHHGCVITATFFYFLSSVSVMPHKVTVYFLPLLCGCRLEMQDCSFSKLAKKEGGWLKAGGPESNLSV